MHQSQTGIITRGLAFAMMVLLTGCQSCKTTPDVKDTTAPTITWGLVNQTTNVATELSGNATFNVNYGDEYLVTPCVNDDGGLSELELYHTTQHRCSDGEFTLQSGPGIVVPDNTVLGLDDNGLAWKKYCRLLSFDFSLECDQGWSFKGGTTSITCEGTNRGGLSTTATLNITIDPLAGS